VLHAVANDGESTRCGFVVSRRLGSAVRRNAVRRRLREIVRPMVAQVQPGADLVFTARPASATADYAALRDAVHDLLRRSRLLGGPRCGPLAAGRELEASR
jgi:ribonuclease P protein component